MTHVYLGWGSLLWDTGTFPLKLRALWQLGGPSVPLEFSRISESRNGALTLVLDPVNGVECPTWFAVSRRKTMDDAICDLRSRENTILKRIGFVNVVARSKHANVYPNLAESLTEWAETRGFSSVIWTDLPSNFNDIKKEPFTIGAAVRHLQALNSAGAREAKEYVSRAPKEIQTPLRRELEQSDWWGEYAST